MDRKRRATVSVAPFEAGQGQVVLAPDGWRAVIDALEGDHTSRDAAFDALQRWAPEAWLDELEQGS